MNQSNQQPNTRHDQETPEIDINAKPDKKTTDEKIDEQIDQSFPASDPPSYSKPGNDDIKPGKEDKKEAKS